jgi:hypothetical protein
MDGRLLLRLLLLLLFEQQMHVHDVAGGIAGPELSLERQQMPSDVVRREG